MAVCTMSRLANSEHNEFFGRQASGGANPSAQRRCRGCRDLPTPVPSLGTSYVYYIV